MSSSRSDPPDVARPRLRELFDDAASRRICVVIGAAGWGKTSAVATWVPQERTAWLHHGDHQGDPAKFVERLVEVLRSHLPASRVAAPAPEVGGQPSAESVVSALCAWLRPLLPDDLVLVVDDLHMLPQDGLPARVVRGLCLQGPARLRLVLISRGELPFSLQRLRGQGEVAEIGAPDLAFEVDDVAALLRVTVGEEPSGLAAHVWTCTGGWPVALNYAIEGLRGEAPDRRLGVLAGLSSPGERFSSYLLEEIVDAEPENVRHVLRRVAAVGEVGAAMPPASDLEDAAVLAELARRGLLLRRGSGRHVTFSLIPMLADYFAHEGALSVDDQMALHSRAAGAYAGRGAHGDALRHFLAAGAYRDAVAVLVEHGEEIVHGGQAPAVLAAADLPAQYLEDQRIQQLLGHARQVCGQWSEARMFYRRAGEPTAGDDSGEMEPGLAWRVGVLAFEQGDLAHVLAACDHARLTGQNPAEEARLLVLAATAQRMMGDLGECRALLARAAEVARRCERPQAWSAVHQGQAILAAAEADRRQAAAHCDEALRHAERAGDLLQLVWIRVCRAFHVLAMGSPRDAARDAETALRLIDGRELPFLTAQALSVRGRARIQLGRLDTARADLTTSVELFQHLGSRFLAWPLCGLGDLHRIKDELVRARSAYEEALTLCEPSRDIYSQSHALGGLARVRAADDLTVARELAERAVAVGERLRTVSAHLTRGWVALMAGDRVAAAADAAHAATAARQRRDDTGLAEAITLEVLSSPDPLSKSAVLGEQISLWRDSGCPLEEAAAHMVAARIGAPLPELDITLAHDTLRKQGIDIGARRAAGPLAVLAASAPAVLICALGAFRVLRDGIPVPKTAWQSRKARDLLRILVARRRPVPREQLLEMLWPETDPAKSGTRLSVLLSTVRETLAPGPVARGPVCSDDRAVWLDPRQVSIDVEEFIAKAEAGLSAHRLRQPDRTEQLRAAVNCYTGGFLEDDPYPEWAQPLAEELRVLHIAVLRALSSRLRETGDVDGVVRSMIRLLEADPYDEPAHLDLVATLHAAGQLGEARRRYGIYRQRMADIGIAPQPPPTGRGE